ncbi:hypothetical protein BDU57DRAFT_524404 [Ampelomyces quisqualis]|uniref:Uncharacterized protein n=1 Tax=Ampelomyces quisqualis TaxID=50730 RepID=A0A6A5Q9E5_AMPQU|nr:hypothetical protein BDU57DRAFT_524404 [Ampelomyces quisqualis]
MSLIQSIELHEAGEDAFDLGHAGPKGSMLYQVLPLIMQTRMPMLPSLRRSVSNFRTGRVHSKNHSMSEGSLPKTPPPGYTSRPASGSTTPSQPTCTASMLAFDLGDRISIAGSEPSVRALSEPVYESSSGIQWQHAKHAMAGLKEAQQMARSSATEMDEVSSAIIRSQYLHSMTLLLRSLPTQLTPGEEMTLSAAIPRRLHPDGTQALVPGSQSHAAADSTAVSQDATSHSIVWRVTAWVVFKMVLLIYLLVPYMQGFLRYAAEFEQEHHLARRALETSFTVASGVSRKVCETACQLQHGILSDATVYCVESVAGGMQQGIAEALRSQNSKGRGRAHGTIAK